ncbi:hypothetical protein [Streptomyces nigrescens]|uniref:hypothetical protein n=1 Tax=Streptomyces nigrescens TaxID=1920 RepID=UPI003F4CE655
MFDLTHMGDRSGAYLMVDMAHFAGLVAAGLHPNPVDSRRKTVCTTSASRSTATPSRSTPARRW